MTDSREGSKVAPRDESRDGELELPVPFTPGHYRVAMVCLGNICRSPVADVVFSARVSEAGLADVVEVISAGTADYHVGRPMDTRSAATLTAAGYDPSRHRARQFERSWHEEVDLILVMDRSNLADVTRGTDLRGTDLKGTGQGRVRLFRDFDPIFPGGEVPDPYYGGEDGFEEVLTMVERTSARLVTLVAGVVGR